MGGGGLNSLLRSDGSDVQFCMQLDTVFAIQYQCFMISQ